MHINISNNNNSIIKNSLIRLSVSSLCKIFCTEDEEDWLLIGVGVVFNNKYLLAEDIEVDAEKKVKETLTKKFEQDK